MTLVYVTNKKSPNYIAESSDIEDNGSIIGASRIGNTVYLIDTEEWKIVLPNLKVSPYVFSGGIAGVAPEYDSSEVGTVDATTVVVTFSEDIVASDYTLGVTIKINDVEDIIVSGTRQTNHAIIYYVITTPVVFEDVVTFEYSETVGGIASETGTVYMADISAQTVTNNVAEV